MDVTLKNLPGTGRGTASRRLVVEGGLLQAKGNNAADCSVQIFQHKGRRNSQDSKAARLQRGIAVQIAQRTVTPVVGQTVNLDSGPPL